MILRGHFGLVFVSRPVCVKNVENGILEQQEVMSPNLKALIECLISVA